MKKGLFIVVGLAALALPLGTTALAAEGLQSNTKHAKPTFTVVKGTVSKVDGDTITVDSKEIKTNDKTVIILDGKPAPADRKVQEGDKITARVSTDGIAARIEIRTVKPHQPGPSVTPGDKPKTDTPQ